MAHQHGRMHLAARQRHRHEEEDDNPGVETVVVVVTQPNTHTGRVKWVTQAVESQNGKPAQTLIDPAVRPGPTTKASPTRSQSKPTAKSSIDFDETLKPTGTPTNTASTIMLAPSSPVVNNGALAPSGGVSTNSESTAAPAAGGLSGGAKAGLALGILFGVGALLAGVLLLYSRKKKQVRAKAAADSEKSAMQSMQNFPPPPPKNNPMPVQSAPSIRTERSMDAAPRLSLRPVTQFSPTFNEKNGHGNDQPSSPWERLGASNNANSNPFNDPQPRSNSPAEQNPFGNNAAIDAQPTSPPFTPMSDNMPDASEFAAVTPAVAAAAVSQNAQRERNLQAPSANGSVPPSPAWTEDFPASPGPAPTGPPPVAGPNNVHRVQLDFKPSMDDELGLRAGQLVRMLHEYDDGWALCVRMDRSQQGVVPRTCLSKHPVKPRTGPPRQPPPGGPRMRGPPIAGPHGGVPQPRPLSPASGRSSPHPPTLSPANGRMSPSPRSMSPGPNQMPPQQPRSRSNSNAPYPGPQQMPPQGRSRSNSNAPYGGPQMPPQGRERSHSNAPYAGPPRSMSPGPYGGGPQPQMGSPQGRPRSNSAGQAIARRGSPPGPSPMNPNANVPMPPRKPLPGQAL